MNVQTAKYFEPVREINTLALENVEKLLDIQLKSINDTAKLGVEQLKAAADIKDADGLKKYFTDQAEVVKSLGERFVKDGQSALELGVSYTDKVQQIVAETVKQEAPIVAKPAAAAAKSK
ncbi:MAG: phasin family protein [Gammaproteobacteria bacterium]|nr:phasin family protein [Gammaproteobacteria bacterium]MCY4209683.1 phasin family protein [Gammaproteobacteria bacterium]MCY4283032.1 phasin family protein [Gammaproteobacteria bacterium]MCY4337911.1 phasin family protein [Gammaproteobacteria bacterium]